jgi:hypothetical protein
MASLTAGTYQAAITVTSGTLSSVIPVSVVVSSGANPPPPPPPTSCVSGVSPLAQLQYIDAASSVDGGASGYTGSTPLTWNGNVMLGPVLDPNGSGRTVNIHRIMQAAPYGWGTTHRSELLWFGTDFPPGADTWQSFAVMRKPGESFPVSQSDNMLVMQSHTPESGNTGPPYALIFDPVGNTIGWDISWNPNPPNTWNYVGGPNPDRYDLRPRAGLEPMMPEGVWYRYILHYRAGYLTSQNPLMEVWRAKPGQAFEKIVNYTGINAYNGANGYARIGVYKWDTDWGGSPSLAFYETPLYFGRGVNLFDQAAASLCGL